MKKVGSIGVGNMGMGMARNILRKGFGLTVYDIREEPLKELAQLGAQVAKTSRGVGERSDVVLIMVFDGSQVNEVVLAEEGLLEGMRPGSTIICTSTIFPSEIKQVAEVVEKKGIYMVDSPVSGGPIRSAKGELTLMVAAKKDVFENCQDIFQAIGKDIYHVGEEIGMGQVTKAAHQVLVGATFAGMAEALVLGVKAGVKAEILYEVMGSGVAGSFLFKSIAKQVMERNFKTSGNIGTMHKDLSISMEVGKECNLPLYATAVAYEMLKATKGLFPEDDVGAIVKTVEKIAGVEVKNHMLKQK